jgi:hypothetical protein
MMVAPTKPDTVDLLRKIGAGFSALKFPSLVRPSVPPEADPTPELLSWGIKMYAFSWVCQFRALAQGAVLVAESRNVPAARVLLRTVFEMGAHTHYVHKHLKQHLDKQDLKAAWDFLLPVATGSRYASEMHPEETDLFPSPAHIGKVVNCFNEVFTDAPDSYSFLSEFAHPNMAAFLQHYKWKTPYLVEFGEQYSDVGAAFSSAAGAAIRALLALVDILKLAGEIEIRAGVMRVLGEVAALSAAC